MVQYEAQFNNQGQIEDASVQGMIADATKQSLTFDLDGAIEVARCLSLQAKPFIGALIELIADEQRRMANKRIAEKSLDG